MEENGGGSRFAALGIGAVVVAVFVLLPFMIVAGFYAFANVQAILTGGGFSSRTLDIPVFLIVLVGTVVMFVLGLFAVISLIGRSFSPKRRDRDREDADAFEEIAQAEPR